jgi:hypothetical protein
LAELVSSPSFRGRRLGGFPLLSLPARSAFGVRGFLPATFESGGLYSSIYIYVI